MKKKINNLTLTHKTRTIKWERCCNQPDCVNNISKNGYLSNKVVEFYITKANGHQKFLGSMTLEAIKKTKNYGIHYETHCDHISTEYRNKGIGVWMYATTISIGFRTGYVTSSTQPSRSACRVWKSRRLKEKYIIRYRNGRYAVQ